MSVIDKINPKFTLTLIPRILGSVGDSQALKRSSVAIVNNVVKNRERLYQI